MPGESDKAEGKGDYLWFPLATYRERLDGLMDAVWRGIEHQAPEALAQMADTARNIADRLDEMALDARQRLAQRERTSESAGTSERGSEPDHPPASPDESDTALD